MAESSSTTSTSYQDRLTIKPLPLLSQLQLDLTALLPSPALVLRSAALASVLLSSITIAIVAWVVFYTAVGVQAGNSETVWLQYGHFRAPYANIPLTPHSAFLATDQPYNVKLEIAVPTSTRNVELGNFMVNLSLTKADGSTSFNVSRPASLAYHSPINLAISSLSPLSFFRSPDVQHLSIPLIESSVLQTRRSVPVMAYIELGRKDAHGESSKWDGGQGELQVYRSTLKFEAELGGIRYILYHHSILSFLIFVPTFIFFELLSCSIIWAFFASRSNANATAPPSTSRPSETEDEKPFEKRDRAEREEARERAKEGRERRGVKMELEELGSESSESGSWEEPETSPERFGLGLATEGEGEVKSEEDDDDEGTIGGSTTTRATLSTFGPSLVSTAPSSSVPSGSGTRRRTTLSGLGEEE